MNEAEVLGRADALLYDGCRLLLKHRRRWAPGGLYPAGVGEPSRLRCETLLAGDARAVVRARVRFLRVEDAEGVAAEIAVGPRLLASLPERAEVAEFRLPAEGGLRELRGRTELSAGRAGDGLYRVRLELCNRARLDDPEERREAERRAFMAAHALLFVEGGRFLSLADPPALWVDAARACRNVGVWPALLGERAVLASPLLLPDRPRVPEEALQA